MNTKYYFTLSATVAGIVDGDYRRYATYYPTWNGLDSRDDGSRREWVENPLELVGMYLDFLKALDDEVKTYECFTKTAVYITTTQVVDGETSFSLDTYITSTVNGAPLFNREQLAGAITHVMELIVCDTF